MEGAVCRKVAETAEKPGKAVGRHRAVGLLPALHAESGRERGRVCILGAVGSLRGFWAGRWDFGFRKMSPNTERRLSGGGGREPTMRRCDQKMGGSDSG